MTLPNILIVLLDDIGIERFNRFGRGNNYPATPTIDSWFDAGSSFSNFIVAMLCSPTRASLETGLHPSLHGIGDLIRGPLTGIPSELAPGLSPGMPNIPRLLRRYKPEYRTAMFGKYHMGADITGGNLSPRHLGYERFTVNMFNMQSGPPNPQTYYDWDVNRDGVESRCSVYHTTQITNEAIEWIKQRGNSPWLCYFAPYAAHVPLAAANVPPAGTYNAVTWPNAASDQFQNFNATTESADYHLARFAAEIPASVWANTLVIFMTDNGSPDAFLIQVTDALTGTLYPSNHAKDSPYLPGVNTPLIFYSPGGLIPFTGQYTKIASIVDILPTVLDYAEIDTSAEFQGLSLKTTLDTGSSAQVHKYVYSEHFIPNGATSDAEKTENQWCIYDGTYTLVYNQPFGTVASPSLFEFYKVSTDPHQLTNLTPSGSTTGLTTTERSIFNAMKAAREEFITR